MALEKIVEELPLLFRWLTVQMERYVERGKLLNGEIEKEVAKWREGHASQEQRLNDSAST